MSKISINVPNYLKFPLDVFMPLKVFHELTINLSYNILELLQLGKINLILMHLLYIYVHIMWNTQCALIQWNNTWNCSARILSHELAYSHDNHSTIEAPNCHHIHKYGLITVCRGCVCMTTLLPLLLYYNSSGYHVYSILTSVSDICNI